MLPSLHESLTRDLASLKAVEGLRTLTLIEAGTSTGPTINKERLLSFSSNDYLGLAHHPLLAAAAAATAAIEGQGGTASRLVSGTRPALAKLEAALASLLSLPSALVFPTGYQANIGLLTALAGPQDLIVSDALNHASLIDGCRLSKATVRIYPHLDRSTARLLLHGSGGFRRRFLLTESLFSMDGDAAPLADLATIATEANAALLVDEAHACGVLGPGGRGLCAAAGVVPDALVGTLGKAFASAGGFVAGEPELRTILVNRARTFIFTTALPPPVAAAANTAVALAQGDCGEQGRAILSLHAHALRPLLPPNIRTCTPGPIFPLVLGTNARAIKASAFLRERGLLVPAIRPPTVPEGTSRLRVTLSAAHTADDLKSLVSALETLAKQT